MPNYGINGFSSCVRWGAILTTFIVLVNSAYADPGFPYLQRVLKEGHFFTIDSLLDRVSDDFPHYFENYTLAYDSFSLHGSDFINPRAIVFGKDASLILTFNGSPEQKAYASLEVMSFNSVRGYEFREILFRHEPGAELSVDTRDVEFSSDTVQISRANPPACIQCHGPDIARPIWQPYAMWPGLYGAFDDYTYVASKVGGTPGHIPLTKYDTTYVNNPERDAFQRFQSARSHNARYSHLSDLPTSNVDDVAPLFSKFYPPSLPLVRHRPGFDLTAIFSVQRDTLIFRDLLTKRPTARQLLPLATALCYREEDEKNAELKNRLSELTMRGKQLDQAFVTDENEAWLEISARLTEVFTDLSTHDIHPFFTAGHSDFMIAQALRDFGIDLKNYSTEFRRRNLYFTGLPFDFPTLQSKVLGALSDLLQRRTTCSDLGYSSQDPSY